MGLCVLGLGVVCLIQVTPPSRPPFPESHSISLSSGHIVWLYTHAPFHPLHEHTRYYTCTQVANRQWLEDCRALQSTSKDRSLNMWCSEQLEVTTGKWRRSLMSRRWAQLQLTGAPQCWCLCQGTVMYYWATVVSGVKANSCVIHVCMPARVLMVSI